MELIQQCYSYLFWGVLVALALCVVAVLVYILKAHLAVDRIIGINLIGALVVIVVCALTYLLGEDYLADIAVIYVVMSFIAVMMLCRIYINLYDRRRKEKEQHDRRMDPYRPERRVFAGGPVYHGGIHHRPVPL